MNENCQQMEVCCRCKGAFEPGTLDFLERCEPCFRIDIQDPKDEPLLFQSTRNPHNTKETKAYVERLQRKRMTPDGGVDHNYKQRIYG
jgi:hypothetical protein